MQKRSAPKCLEYSRLLKHFSQWDYEFHTIYSLAVDEQLQQLGLYLRVRELVLHSIYNKGKKELLSGVTADLGKFWATQSNGPTWPGLPSGRRRRKISLTSLPPSSSSTTSKSKSPSPTSTHLPTQNQRRRVFEDMSDHRQFLGQRQPPAL